MKIPAIIGKLTKKRGGGQNEKQGNDLKLLAVLSLVVLAVSLIPLFMIGRYAHPCADDFGYGYFPHAFWSTTHSLPQTFYWACRQVKMSYDTWQGTFSSIFLMALTPAVWGESFYFLTPIIMILNILFSHFYLLHVILVKGLKTDKYAWCTVSSILCFLMIQTVVSPVNAFFWYNGAVHYTFMHACMVALLGLVIHLEYVRKIGSKILLTVLSLIFAVACGGANYSTALLGLVCLVFILLMKLLSKKRSLWILAPLAVYAFSFYKSVTAYGNVVRQGNFTKMQPLKAVMESFLAAGKGIGEWLTLPLLLFILLLVPVLWNVVKKCSFPFRYPWAVTLLSYCLIACMYTPALYSMGGEGPERLINIVKMWFLLLLILNIGYWMGAIWKKAEGKKISVLSINLKVYALVILATAAVCVKLLPTSLRDYSSYAAYVSLRAGEAKQYHEEYLQRLELLESDAEAVELEEFTVKPYLLYFDDITEDPYDWRNIGMARWYGKSLIYRKQ